MRALLVTAAVLIVIGCAQSRVKAYRDILDPMVGTASKKKIEATLGAPSACERDRCEYRTVAGRNLPTPSVHAPAPGFGPDVSPYEHFDVIHVYFNDLGVVREWQPVSVQ